MERRTGLAILRPAPGAPFVQRLEPSPEFPANVPFFDYSCAGHSDALPGHTVKSKSANFSERSSRTNGRAVASRPLGQLSYDHLWLCSLAISFALRVVQGRWRVWLYKRWPQTGNAGRRATGATGDRFRIAWHRYSRFVFCDVGVLALEAAGFALPLKRTY